MGDSRESRLDRKWRNDQQGEKSGQVRVRGRQRRDNKKPDGEKQGERKKSGNERRVSSSGKPSNNRASSKNRGNNNNPRANAIRRRRNENYFLTKTPPFWPFHFSVSGKMKDKSAMEQKGVKEEVVLRLCSDLNIPLVLPESLTMVIETNARLFELYGASHPWRYKHTLTSSPLSVSSPCYPDTQIDVVGVSVVEWVPIPLRPNTEELEGLIEMASFDRKNISVAFVNVGEYSLPDQRRLSACCMVNWEKEGFLIELQVCCQVYFSVREEEEDGEKRTEFHLSRKGQAYISGYRGFSTEVPDRPYNQIWEALLPSLKERGDQMLNLRKKVGVHILGDFGEFEKSKVLLFYFLFFILFFGVYCYFPLPFPFLYLVLIFFFPCRNPPFCDNGLPTEKKKFHTTKKFKRCWEIHPTPFPLLRRRRRKLSLNWSSKSMNKTHINLLKKKKKKKKKTQKKKSQKKKWHKKRAQRRRGKIPLLLCGGYWGPFGGEGGMLRR